MCSERKDRNPATPKEGQWKPSPLFAFLSQLCGIIPCRSPLDIPTRRRALERRAAMHSTMRSTQATVWLGLVSGVAAHGRLLIPEPRPPVWRDQSMQGHTNAEATYRHDEPAVRNSPKSGLSWTPKALRRR